MNTNSALASPSFEDAKPLGLGDAKFIRELHDVLERHGNLDRFGICLLHDHFHIGTDEILIERNDPYARTLQLKVVKREELPKVKSNVKFTSWRIGGPHAEPLEKGELLAEGLRIEVDADDDSCLAKTRIKALTACSSTDPNCNVRIETLATSAKTETLTA